MGKPINQLIPDLKKNIKDFIKNELAEDIKNTAEDLTPRGETRYAYTQWEVDTSDPTKVTVGNRTDYLEYPELGSLYQEPQLFTKRAIDIEVSKNRVIKPK